MPSLHFKHCYFLQRFRFVDMIIALKNCLAVQNLPAYFNRRINLLAEYKADHLLKIRGYLKRIANKGEECY